MGAAQDNYITSTLNSGQNSPFLSGAIDAAIAPILNDAVDRALQDRSAFTLAGQKIQGSSAFAEDQLRDRQETDRTIGNVAAQIAFQDAQLQQQNKVQAATLATARLQDQRESISALALPRLVEQMGIDKANAELARRFQVIEESLFLMADLANPTPVNVSSGAGGGVEGLDKLGGF